MDKLELNLENCYGIKKLYDNIEFKKLNRSNGAYEAVDGCLIYASNGTMKTSFAKTFLDIENERKTSDLIEPSNKTTREVKIDGKEISKDDVLVIQTYVSGYDSDNKSKLLVSKKLKKEYDEIWSEISKNKDSFLKGLKRTSGISNLSEIEKEITDIFNDDGAKDLCATLEKIKDTYDFFEVEILKDIKYKELINDDVEKILAEETISNALSEYIEKYHEILEKSEIYKPGVFDNTKATFSLKALKDNSFFKANHKIILENKLVLGEDEFEAKMKEVEDKILTDEEMKEKFQAIETALTKKTGLRNFKELLYKKQGIIPLLVDYNNLKKTMWINYFLVNIQNYNILLSSYVDNKDRLREIIKVAKKESTTWEEVTKVFNDRFDVPFRVEVTNQEDVILKEEALILKFVYKTGASEKTVDRLELEECLSNGEKKALYILNILYELEARKIEGKEYLIILDDIADSFDYRNKYAIIEYLNDIMSISTFKLIILTHNFDFYRSVASRLNLNSNKFFAIKQDGKIVLKEGEYTKNVFATWKRNINEPKIFISSVAFVRNIIEYIEGKNTDYEFLTNILHYKITTNIGVKSTTDILVQDVHNIFKRCWNITTPFIIDGTRKMLDLIFDTAEDIKQDANVNEIKIENKIVLSIAIRLKAEQYMIRKINDDTITNAIKENQTRGLIKNMDFNMPSGKEIKTILEEVLIMTSENIHINSFMYEPIIDMSLSHLIKLYDKVCGLK